VGQTWTLVEGPHNTNLVGIVRNGAKPWTSLDFAGGDGIVHAAASGIAYHPCGNLVVIDHPSTASGTYWETAYYHMWENSIPIPLGGQQKVNAGDVIGRTGGFTGCNYKNPNCCDPGSQTFSAHLHFSVYRFLERVHTGAVFVKPSGDIGEMGVVLGGWRVEDDPVASGAGCMKRIDNGLRQCYSTGRIYNDPVLGGPNASGTTGAQPHPVAVNGSPLVYFRGTDNAVHQAHFVSDSGGARWVTDTVSPGPVVGDPQPVVVNGSPLVFFHGTDNAVHQAHFVSDYGGARWVTDTVSPGPTVGDPQPVAVNGDPVIYSAGALDDAVHQVHFVNDVGGARWVTDRVSPGPLGF
jgi:murein DD-endopeptidase MepM/ murein hydrolase activator NlpD